jgi:hypothetical protein
MNDMFEKLTDLAKRLKEEGRHEDSMLLYQAAIKFVPDPVPKYEKLTNPIPGYYIFCQAY